MYKGDPAPMLRRITVTLLTFAIAIITLACGGGDDPPQADPQTQVPASQATTAQTQTEAQPQDPMPTRPQRLDLSPTEPAKSEEKTQPAPEAMTAETPDTAQSAETAGSQPQAEQTPNAQPEKTAGTGSPLDLIPEDPETSDEVLLQDIYALMDLSQFALDPNQPVPLPQEGIRDFGDRYVSALPGGDYPPSYFNFDDVKDHPYLHLFPGLKAHVEAYRKREMENPGSRSFRNRDIPYNPHRPYDQPERVLRESQATGVTPPSGITYFIYNPWFENPDSRWKDVQKKNQEHQPIPHWFGKNSTRGVLAEAVEKALQQAKKEDAKQAELPVEVKPEYGSRIQKQHYDVNMSLGGYLRTPLTNNGLNMTRHLDAHKTPFVQWELLHHRLPIVKVTATVITLLPLAGPDGEPATATFSTSFVMSFQNRWASFDDPGRSMIRRGEKAIWDSPRGSDSGEEFHKQHFPNYWHHDDYMQHRLIGPVVVTVHENPATKEAVTIEWCQEILKGGAPATIRRDCKRVMESGEEIPAERPPSALIPGTYAVEPRISHWKAPGPVLTDEQFPEYWVKSHHNPSPNWPLPGHVLTTPTTGPGTEIWKELGMDQYDW